MTRDEFLRLFQTALTHHKPEILVATDHIYPKGPMIRVRVYPPGLPPREVDPVGLVWYLQHRQARSVLDSFALAGVLGLTEDQTENCLQASDLMEADLDTPEQQAWRAGLLRVFEAYAGVELCARFRP